MQLTFADGGHAYSMHVGFAAVCMVRTAEIQYIPSTRLRRRYLARKVGAFLVYVFAAVLVSWLAWPGLTAPSSVNPGYLMDPEFWVFVSGLFVCVVLLVFLIVLTWNERLPCIDAGRLDRFRAPVPHRRAPSAHNTLFGSVEARGGSPPAKAAKKRRWGRGRGSSPGVKGKGATGLRAGVASVRVYRNGSNRRISHG